MLSHDNSDASRARSVTLATALALFVASCASSGRTAGDGGAGGSRAPDAQRVETIEGRVGPVDYALLERPLGRAVSAPDYGVRPGGDVDRNSLIVVDFAADDPGRPREELGDGTWTAINAWLRRLEDYTERQAALARKIESAREQGTLGQLIDEVEAFNSDVVTPLEADGRAFVLLLEPDLAEAQDAAEADPDAEVPDDWVEPLTAFLEERGSDTDLLGYADYLAERLAAERQELRDTLDEAGQVRVLVSAFAGEIDTVRLHVENYDSIESAGATAPKNLGFDLSPETRARVKRELEQAEDAQQVLETIDARLDDLVALSEALVERLEQAVVALGGSLEERLSAIPAEDADGHPFASAALTFRNLEALLRDATVPAEVASARDALQAFAAEAATAAEAVQALLAAGEALLELDLRRDLMSALRGGSTRVPAAADHLLAQATTARAAIEAALDAARALPDNLSAIDAGAALAESVDLVPDDIHREIEHWLEELEPWIAVATKAGAVLGLTDSNLAAAAEAVEAGDGVSLPRTLNDLRDGLVELGRNVETGDRVRVVVQTIDEDDRVLDRRCYDFNVTWMGWRRDVRGEAIFARGDSGPDEAQDWKPNIAALASWHYRYRSPDGTWGRFVNWLDPGFGVHAASLDLSSDESTEIGLGVQARFWDGLLFVGVGQDLHVDEDRTYYFVGTSLLKLLGELSN